MTVQIAMSWMDLQIVCGIVSVISMLIGYGICELYHRRHTWAGRTSSQADS